MSKAVVLNWRTKRDQARFSMRPPEGSVIYYAKKGGVTYHIQANYENPLSGRGAVVWQAFAGVYIGSSVSLDSAKERCERKANAGVSA